jgi:beta-1,4-mannosyl-glycoprotein beta-1,4-N-acetylglucosaminyltransferase
MLKSMPPKRISLYDCFSFNKEFDVLEIRLNELYDVVDKFIIFESMYTYTGVEKELHLKKNIEKYKKFLSKMILISDTTPTPKLDPVRREKYQRGKISDALRQCNVQPHDLIFFSDCDEIPRARILLQIKENPTNCILELDGFVSFYNLYFEKWQRGRAIEYKQFKSVQHLHRDYWIQSKYKHRRFKKFPLMRIDRHFSVGFWDQHIGVWVGFSKIKPLEIVPKAGWHFTKMFSESDILDSIRSNVHTEINTPELDIDKIKQLRNEHKLFYGKDLTGVPVPLDNSFPKFLLDNVEKYRRYLIFD